MMEYYHFLFRFVLVFVVVTLCYGIEHKVITITVKNENEIRTKQEEDPQGRSLNKTNEATKRQTDVQSNYVEKDTLIPLVDRNEAEQDKNSGNWIDNQRRRRSMQKDAIQRRSGENDNYGDGILKRYQDILTDMSIIKNINLSLPDQQHVHMETVAADEKGELMTRSKGIQISRKTNPKKTDKMVVEVGEDHNKKVSEFSIKDGFENVQSNSKFKQFEPADVLNEYVTDEEGFNAKLNLVSTDDEVSDKLAEANVKKMIDDVEEPHKEKMAKKNQLKKEIDVNNSIGSENIKKVHNSSKNDTKTLKSYFNTNTINENTTKYSKPTINKNVKNMSHNKRGKNKNVNSNSNLIKDNSSYVSEKEIKGPLDKDLLKLRNILKKIENGSNGDEKQRKQDSTQNLLKKDTDEESEHDKDYSIFNISTKPAIPNSSMNSSLKFKEVSNASSNLNNSEENSKKVENPSKNSADMKENNKNLNFKIEITNATDSSNNTNGSKDIINDMTSKDELVTTDSDKALKVEKDAKKELYRKLVEEVKSQTRQIKPMDYLHD